MSSSEGFRDFINERLSAAAEEIFRVFKRTIVEYEEEIERQRRILENVWEETQRAEPDEDLHDQKPCFQDMDSTQDRKSADIKEEEEQLCISEGREKLFLKQQAFVLNSYEENENLLLFHNETENQAPSGEQHENTTASATEHERNLYDGDGVHGPDSDCDAAATKSLSCDRCDRKFQCWSLFQRHLSVHAELHLQQEPPETEVYPDLQLCHHQRTSGCAQDDGEGQDSACTSLHGEASVLKHEQKRGQNLGNKQLLFGSANPAKRRKRRGNAREDSESAEETDSEPQRSLKGTGGDFHDSAPSMSTTPADLRAFTCDTCGKEFQRKSSLDIHMRIHTGERPYPCTTCGKRFSRLQDLQRHMKIHTGEKSYTCETCGKGFLLNCQLKSHIKVHAGEKPFACNTCGKRFCRKPDLKRHIRIHTGEKQFPCAMCGRRFRGNGDLIHHMRKDHTRQEPYL